jgi:hypothetical protein
VWGRSLTKRTINLQPLAEMGCCITNPKGMIPELFIKEDQEQFLQELIAGWT